MDQESAKYAEAVGPVRLDEDRAAARLFEVVGFIGSAALLVFGLWLVVSEIFSLEAPQADLRIHAYTIQQSKNEVPYLTPPVEVRK